MFYKVVMIIICAAFSLSAQYKLGAAYLNKSEVPFEGMGLQLERNLPVQFPDIGAKVRLEIDYFSSNLVKKYSAFDADLSLIVSYFLSYFQPYAGLGFGHSYFSSYNGNEVKKYPFHLSFLAGFDLKILENIYPFFEGQIYRYLSAFDEAELTRYINTIQLRFAAGIKIDINIID